MRVRVVSQLFYKIKLLLHKYMLLAGWEVRIGKTETEVLKMLP